MNKALKHWKEAATVILAAGAKHRAGVSDGVKKCTILPPTSSHKPALPLTAAFDYQVLVLKRSDRSGFMPNAYVFPGGLVDASDFSSDWLEIFKSYRHSPNFGVGAVRQSFETRPPLFATDRSKLGSPISSEVAFRICAIRETFEESGVLLVISKKCENSVVSEGTSRYQPGLTEVTRLWDKRLLAQWRLRVIQNPVSFIHMCEALECIPNIWALYEWGNWLTPAGVPGNSRRYDTAFFLCCLKEIPETVQDEKEIVHFKWSTPSEILRSFQTQEIWIASPQVYDLGRLSRFHRLQELHDFAQGRALEGCERWMPMQLVTADCRIMLLPGDCLYPEGLDRMEPRNYSVETEKTLEELLKEGGALHRVIFHDRHTTTSCINITPKYKHAVPLLCSGSIPEHTPTHPGPTEHTSKL